MIKSKPCIVDGCNYPRFAKGYCKVHQHLREDKKVVAKKPRKIKPISDKRKMDNEKYKAVKEKKKADLLAHNKFVCFFSGKPLDAKEDIEWHHLCNKDGSLLYEYDNIFPVIRKYHTAYHHEDISTLLKEQWYVNFLDRVEEKKENNKYIKCVFEKEARRIDKMF